MATAALGVLGDARFAAVFGPGSRAEVALAGRAAGLPADTPVAGRVDRLVVEPDRVLVVDFKTNRPPPAREEEVSDLYLDQMALYRAGAARVLPGRRIVCGLLFTDGPRLLRLSDAILDRQWAGLVQRLDPKAIRS